MRIDSSAVGMESARSYRASRTTVTRFSVTDYRESMTQGRNALHTQIGNENQANEENEPLTAQQREKLEEIRGRLQRFGIHFSVRDTPAQTYNSIRNQTVNYILDLFFGYRRSNYQLQPMELQPVNAQQFDLYQESAYYESETTNFSTQGTVRTSDGREITFQVNVGMSREFQQQYQEELKMSQLQLTDPLVINLDGDVADVSDQTFFFDLDGDGVLDKVNQLGSGSGFLALDKNGDGTINDGTELFGTASGNGFKDLARYDDDGDGWIDEDDAVWSKLRIWCKDENGKDVLYSLAESGVGAICLQNVGTEFTQQAQDGSVKGVVRNTGVFLYENGTAGTVQHVDLVNHSYSA